MLNFRHPTTLRIAEPTQTGKTFFFKQIIDQQLIKHSPSRVFFLYGDHPPDLNDVKDLSPSVDFVEGMKIFIQILPFIDPAERNLVVLDGQLAVGVRRWRKCPNFWVREPTNEIAL